MHNESLIYIATNDCFIDFQNIGLFSINIIFKNYYKYVNNF